MDRKRTGSIAEEKAAAEYIKKGYVILCRNFYCRTGEIDIIAKNTAFLVFCEVKYRATLTFGSGAQAVTKTKIRRIIRAAKEYLYIKSLDLSELQPRFDVAVVTKESLEIIENAFGVDEYENQPV
ncbi:hypothetical protein SDC9_97243 [bioreactor metagenome]|uniref:Uncharacterized protein n=1 Tax=bioreactor metagenome TaxID=1076179 RepID=A0A645ADY7_9ZZZZ